MKGGERTYRGGARLALLRRVAHGLRRTDNRSWHLSHHRVADWTMMIESLTREVPFEL